MATSNTTTANSLFTEKAFSTSDGLIINYATTTTPTDSTVLLTELTSKIAVPNDFALIGGFVLTTMGGIMSEKNGQLLKGGVAVGRANLKTGQLTLTDWQDGANSKVDAIAKLISRPAPITQLLFRMPQTLVQVGSFGLTCELSTGEKLTLTTNDQGKITGSPYAHGYVDYKNGVVMLSFSEQVIVTDEIKREPYYHHTLEYEDNGKTYIDKPYFVYADTIRYNAVAYTYTALSKDIVGLDPARLPTDGRVPFVQVGDVAVLTEEFSLVLDSPSPKKRYDTRPRLSTLKVIDSAGKIAPHTANLDTGVLTLGDSLDGLNLPLTATYRIYDIFKVEQVDISGQVVVNMPPTHDYSTNAVFSTAIINNGDGVVQARAYNVFSQKSWDNTFNDEPKGERANIQLNHANYPIVVKNDSAISERWALIFTSTTQFRIVGETVGEIGIGQTNNECSPINPVTSKPYFTISPEAWSQGGTINNVVRFNTTACCPHLWLGASVQPHQTHHSNTYDFAIEHQANVDRVRGE